MVQTTPAETGADAASITSGRFLLARIPAGALDQVMTGQGATVSPAYAAAAAAAAGALTGATLASGVTASSLTSFGASPTITTPVLTLATGTPTGAARLEYSGGFGRLGDGTTSQVLVSEAQTQTLAAKTLNLPTIADLTNMGHGHLNVAGGATLDAAAIAAGRLALARLPAGTLNQVLTAQGAGADPIYAAVSAGGAANRITMASIFEASGRFGLTVVGGGANTFGGDGLDQTTSATSGSSCDCAVRLSDQGAVGAFFAGSPVFSCVLTTTAFGALTLSSYSGLGTPTVGAAGHTYTVNHIGHKLIGNGTNVQLYATQADGTTENASSSLATLSAGTVFDLVLVVNSTTSVDYYRRTNGGALSAATNLTSNLPTALTIAAQFSVSNNNVANAVRVWHDSFSYQR